MFDFRFVYAEDNFYDVHNVTNVFVRTPDGLSELSKEDISEANIPFQTLHLYSEVQNYIVSMNDVRAIEIMNRD